MMADREGQGILGPAKEEIEEPTEQPPRVRPYAQSTKESSASKLSKDFVIL